MSAETSILIALGALPAVMALALIAAAGLYVYYGRQERLRAARSRLRALIASPAALPAPLPPAPPPLALPPFTPPPRRPEGAVWEDGLSRLRGLASSLLQAWQARREERRAEGEFGEATRLGALASGRDEEEAEPSGDSGAAD